MFNDPAPIFGCDLPIGWCPDAESSLFPRVIRRWDNMDERVILTILPSAVAPTAPDADWASAVISGLKLENQAEPLTIAAGTAITATLITTTGPAFRRIVVRGTVLDLVTDHVQTGGEGEEISPVLLTIAASTRISTFFEYGDGLAGRSAGK